MRKAAGVTVLLLLATGLVFWPRPVGSASKEIIQLQRDVALLQQQVRELRQSVDRGNAVLKTLIEQSSDTVNRMILTVEELDKSVKETVSGANVRIESLTTQVRALRDSVDEMGARFGRVSQQLAETQSVLQSVDGRLAASSARPAGEAGRPAGTPPQAGSAPPAGPSAPSADALYSSALRDFNSGNYELSEQQFKDYLRFYRETELGGNAQYYLGEIEYQRRRFQSAIAEYDKVLTEFPDSYKTAASYLKKGYALLGLDQRAEAVAQLRIVVEKFARWDEAKLARSRLQRLGEAVPE